MKKKRIAVISAVAVRDANSLDTIPIQIRVVRYENGIQDGILESMVNPISNVILTKETPGYLNPAALSYAPHPNAVATQVNEFVRGCELRGSEAGIVTRFLQKNLCGMEA